MFQTIQAMSVSEKLDLARKGSKEARSILIRDANKLVQLAVIQSPKITEGEVLMIANNRQINEEVLKHVAINREWLKNYQVRVALANNPKTPLPEALRQVAYLKARELTQLAKSKSVARALAVVAEQRLKQVKK
ncbi:MAG: hypothetical protein WDA72_01685 [Desulfomonilia bacterium]|nr:hypothetical protein [Deltaproteobacteria bacterium]MDX9762229.1 hypothetical protein [Desulfomonilia bacterium]HPW69679.1 hypothetical protein [Deltaproteobacteria bacterium]